MSRLGAFRRENPSFAFFSAPLFKNIEDAIAHRHLSPSFFGLAVRHEDHAGFPIQVLDPHPVKLGYELERGKHGQPEIKGYTKEYLEASSPRREQIKDHLREQGIDGAAAAQIAAHHTRDRKELLSPGEVLQRHRELAAQYGHQADRVVAQALQHGQYQMPEPEVQAKRAVTWARDHVFERSAVQDRRAILETALVRGMGETTYAQVRQEFERRIEAGEFREVSHIGAGQQYTTATMVRMELEVVGRMQEGNRRDYRDPMLVSPQVRIATEDRHPELMLRNTRQ